MMKKELCILMTVALLGSMSLGVSAEEAGELTSYPEIGVSFSEDLGEMKGYFESYPAGAVPGGGTQMAFLYLAAPAEEAIALMESEDPEDQEKMESILGVMGYLLSLDKNQGLPELIDLLEGAVAEEEVVEVGKAGEYTFFYLPAPDEEGYLASIEPEFAEDYANVQAALLESLQAAEYTEPVIPGSELIGQKLEFETTDLDGNAVNSADLFAQHEVTMINVWATWCPPCKAELPGLQELNTTLAEKNCAVIGLLYDGNEEGMTELGKSLLEENGVTYLNILPNDAILEQLPVSAFPTSFFVGSDGTILATPFEGAPPTMDSYEDVVDSVLPQ